MQAWDCTAKAQIAAGWESSQNVDFQPWYPTEYIRCGNLLDHGDYDDQAPFA
jgi:hypothetical protein